MLNEVLIFYGKMLSGFCKPQNLLKLHLWRTIIMIYSTLKGNFDQLWTYLTTYKQTQAPNFRHLRWGLTTESPLPATSYQLPALFVFYIINAKVGVNLQTFLGLALPNQYCQTVVKEMWDWFFGWYILAQNP